MSASNRASRPYLQGAEKPVARHAAAPPFTGAPAKETPMRRSVRAVSCLLVFAALSGPVFAQRTTGSVVGVVKDDTGAVLPGATVTIRGEGIVGAQTSVSNEHGLYRFAALPPGSYDLSFAWRGSAPRTARGSRSPLARPSRRTPRSS